MYSTVYIVFWLLSVGGASALMGWALWDVLWRQRSRRQARFEPDRAQLRRLQAKRRLALRRLGSRWVLHPNQPAARWGNHRD